MTDTCACCFVRPSLPIGAKLRQANRTAFPAGAASPSTEDLAAWSRRSPKYQLTPIDRSACTGSSALHGKLTLDKGQVQQSNFHDYPLLRIADCPTIEVDIIPSNEHPSGVGEPGTPPIAPAVANAVFALTGQRLRSLPLRLT